MERKLLPPPDLSCGAGRCVAGGGSPSSHRTHTFSTLTRAPPSASPLTVAAPSPRPFDLSLSCLSHIRLFSPNGRPFLEDMALSLYGGKVGSGEKGQGFIWVRTWLIFADSSGEEGPMPPRHCRRTAGEFGRGVEGGESQTHFTVLCLGISALWLVHFIQIIAQKSLHINFCLHCVCCERRKAFSSAPDLCSVVCLGISLCPGGGVSM